jgi:hypothetical protein
MPTLTRRRDADASHEVGRAAPLADPEVAARKILQIANGVEVVQDGRIPIEKINWPFLYEIKGTPAEYTAGSA